MGAFGEWQAGRAHMSSLKTVESTGLLCHCGERKSDSRSGTEAAASWRSGRAIDELQPFPRKFLPTLFDNCKTEHELPHSKEWQNHLKYVARHFRSDDFDEQCDFVAGPSGCRFLPARPICTPIPSESLYTPVDTPVGLAAAKQTNVCLYGQHQSTRGAMAGRRVRLANRIRRA